MVEKLPNYIGGAWTASRCQETLDVENPATLEVLGRVPAGAGTAEDVASAVKTAVAAQSEWRDIPVGERVQPLFRLKQLLEEHREDLARTITGECGKTIGEARGEMQRAIENVEVASGAPMLMQSEFIEGIARGIDEFTIRQPVGVSCCIAPFNFPGMIVFWFLPYALACGNAFIVKPSEKVPLTMVKIFELLDGIGLPKGLVNLVHGGRETVDALLEHPDVKSVSFVGSSAVAKYVYSKAAAAGKRVQAQAGAKNPLVVLPDADLETAARIVGESVYGCAGQRCLAASNVITVGDEGGTARDAIVDAAQSRVTGYGLDESSHMGPVISARSKARVESLIDRGIREGAKPVLDGRGSTVRGYENGHFITPTILENVPLKGELAKTEIFGPVMSLIHLKTIEEAIDLINAGTYGNMACLFTRSGFHARAFRHRVQAGNIGINIGVAAPKAQFPFSGWKESFFGDLHGQGKHAIEFFTQTKVVVERWPNEGRQTF